MHSFVVLRAKRTAVTLGHIGSRLITRGRPDKAGSLPDAGTSLLPLDS